MMPGSRASLLRIHISETDRYEAKPLYEAIVDRCRAMNIAGATVFRGIEGFGETAAMHRPHLIGHDEPLVICIVDTAEQIERLIPAVQSMMTTGMMAVSEVDAVRVLK